MKYQIPKHNYIFFNEVHRNVWMPQKKRNPSDWVEENFVLSSAYAVTGKIKLFVWQREPIDACDEVDELYYIAPVQTGKSMMGEAIIAYKVDTTQSNMMLCYSKKEVVKDVFDERLRPLITETPALKKYWSGNPNDLTQKKIKLLHATLRIAGGGESAKDDIASFNAAIVYGSEVAKWPKKNFDQIKMLRGRQKASQMLGEKTFMILESSPRLIGDKLHTETHKKGVEIREPYQPCPHCGKYQILVDTQIKEIPNDAGERDHDPERIRSDNAAYYECIECKGAIDDTHRIEMAERVVWAAKHETVLNNGSVVNRKRCRKRAYHWNRLINYNYGFADCLASYFEALNDPDPQALITYLNEDMSIFAKLKSNRSSEKFLQSKKQRYVQYGEKAFIPNEVLVLLVAIDTQDNGFYYVVRGYGANLESWLVRHDFITCPMDKDEYQNPKNVLDQINDQIFKKKYTRKDGKRLNIIWGLIDRGGHRSNDVDYICDHNLILNPYIGSTVPTAPMIELKKSGFYFCNKRNLSLVVEKQMKTSLWHLPHDVTGDYCKQVLNQYYDKVIDTKGNEKMIWVENDPDHYRDCENMLVAASIHLNLNEVMNDPDSIESLGNQDYIEEKIEPDETEEPDTFFDADSFLKQGGWR